MAGLRRVIEETFRSPHDGSDDIASRVRRISQMQAPLRHDEVVDAALATLHGLGPLDEFLADPDVTDVLVNGPSEIWVERAGDLTRTDARFPGEMALVAAVERMLLPLGLRLDRSAPAVDARLPDGSRLHAMVPPASVDGVVVAIRRFSAAVRTLDDLVGRGSIDPSGAGVLEELVKARRNLIVSGSTGAGKTTLLNVMSTLIGSEERIVTIEESAELDVTGHVVRLEARPPNAEGAGEVTVRSLVRHALRMRPDRIVVGEVRGAESFDLIQAMSTGHAGSMGTVHAAGPDEALWRLETLASMAPERVPSSIVERMLRSAVDAVVHVERGPAGRRVASVSSVAADRVELVWHS